MSVKSSIQESIDLKTKVLGMDAEIQQLVELMVNCYKKGNKLLICGNGGSTCDSMHFAEELVARYKLNRPALSALSLSDPSTITCAGNDFGFESIFSRQVEAFGQSNDILVALSTSGNSPNVIKAVEKAKEKKMITVGFLGGNGGKLKRLVDHPFVVPSENTARIQEVHMLIIHIICDNIEQRLFA